MTVQAIRITENSSKAHVEEAIKALRAKQNRMPSHWVDAREAVAVELEELVERRLRMT